MLMKISEIKMYKKHSQRVARNAFFGDISRFGMQKIYIPDRPDRFVFIHEDGSVGDAVYEIF